MNSAVKYQQSLENPFYSIYSRYGKVHFQEEQSKEDAIETIQQGMFHTELHGGGVWDSASNILYPSDNPIDYAAMAAGIKLNFGKEPTIADEIFSCLPEYLSGEDMFDQAVHLRLTKIIQDKTVDVIFCIEKRDESGKVIDNLGDVPIQGRYRIAYRAYGCDEYISPVLEDATWLELSVIANDAIHFSGDFDHVFLEGYTRWDDRTYEGLPVYGLFMGS